MEAANSITEPIKVLMPKAIKSEDRITIIFSVMGKPQIPFHIMFEKCTIKQQLGKVHEKDVNRLIRKGTISKKIDIDFVYGKEKVFIRKSEVTFSLICSDQKRRIVKYECMDENTFKLLSFQIEDAVWEKIFEQNDVENDEESKEDYADSYGIGASTDFETSYIPYESPALTKYKNALLREMYYLRSEGGRQYKVSNGKRISSANSFYTYVFDMESELYIAADSPITINAGNGNETSGTVLMCEDFIIMVALVSDFGEKVSSAFVCVEPWKLLEALVNRISTINKVQNEISINLLEKGPKLASKQSIQLVPKGQKVAYDRALTDQILMIWGPPGTGKTYTLSRIAETYLTKGKSVLIVSHSNVSVDGLMEGLAKRLRANQKNSRFLTDGKVLRYGYVRNERLAQDEEATSFNFAAQNLVEDKDKLVGLEKRKEQLKKTGEVKTLEFRDIVLEIKRLRTKISERESEYVKKAQLVATTISKVMIDKIFEKRQYDVVMFDEISMAYIPQILGASIHAREHLICVGDFRQLSPIVQSDAKETLQDDIFTYLGIVDRMGNMYMHPWLVMLNEQRRMHPAISKFSNREVYDGLLLDHASVKDDTRRNEIISMKPFSDEPIELIDLFGSYCAADKNSDNSRFNILSAIVSFATAINAEKEDEQIEVGIITPYAAQTRLVRALILDYRKNGETEIRCSTVHQFQGSECDVIIFDAVESYPTTKTGFLMSKNENAAVTRLINVAVTRARNKLVVVANAKFWTNQYEKTQHIFYKLIKHIQRQNKCLTYEQDRLKTYFSTLKLGKLLNVYENFEDATSDFIKDISNASVNVIISLPSGEMIKGQQEIIYKSVIDCVKKGITVLSKCNDYINLPVEWKTFTVGTENATFPIIVIDDKIVWYGMPYANWKFVQDKTTAYRTVVRPIIRLQGEHTVEMIKTLSDLEFKKVGTNRTALVQKSVDKFQISEEDDGKNGAGLGAFIEENYTCPECGTSYKLARGRSGKCYLQCPDKSCKNVDYLTPDTINYYINRKNVKCPIHKAGICGGLGKYGVYVKCDYGHFMKPDEI